MANKRRSIELLPVALQTETLSKFFAATLDHLMQPESVEFLTGYIGSKPSYYDPTKDFYVNEPTKTREQYQLPVAAVNADINSGVTNNIMFYDDMVNLLKFHGANVSNHSRLFDQEYYSWSPPIDIDKLVNYTRYFWVPDGPSTITLLDTTDANKDIIGASGYTYSGAWRIDSTGEIITKKPLVMTNGLSIIFDKDKSADLNGQKLILDGVGTYIQLLQDRPVVNPAWNTYGWNVNSWNGNDAAYIKRYVTISRYCKDSNQWSQDNRWFHQDVLEISKTLLTNINVYRASRPIIEFQRNLKLWDYGWHGRGIVDLVVFNLSDVFGAIVGRPGYIYDGIPLTDGMRILVSGDSDPNINNRIYTVSGIYDYGSIALTLDTDGQNADGSPAVGDRFVVRYGTYGGRNYWYTQSGFWNGNGQQLDQNIGPLFELYDVDGNSLADPSVYPGSDFSGNFVFNYTVDQQTSPFDDELGFSAKRDQFGSFVFDNAITTVPVLYKNSSTKAKYYGYQFYRVEDENGNYSYGNGWHKSASASRQYIVNDYFNVNVNSLTNQVTFRIDQLPAPQVPGELSTIRVFRIRNQTKVELTQTVDYKTQMDPITNLPILVVSTGVLRTGDRLEIKTWNPAPPVTLNGYYELPLNLTANPNNKEITSISQSQLLDQFKQIMENQAGFQGNPLGNNNFRDTKQDASLGLSILQHRAPMLKLMVLGSGDVTTGITSSQSNTDPMLAIQFAQREYIRFYGRFIRSLNNLYKNGYTLNNPPEDWISAAFKQINLGKTPASPWANSGYDLLQGSYCATQSSEPNFIPPTATRLGITPAYQPMVYLVGAQVVIQTHDGSRIIMEDEQGNSLGTISNDLQETRSPNLLTNPIAKVWLQFELNIFNNLPERYKSIDADLVFDTRIYGPGKWRNSDYSKEEYTTLLRPMFDKWIIVNQADYTANTTFDLNDQFTFNYSQVTDKQGNPVPGNWRGIYRWFYDTDRPHTHPWEMLGFSQKPTWWDLEYGVAPYTSGNTRMWSDLRDGVIKRGERAGTYQAWARPGLLQCIPVDTQGNLLPPLGAGTVASLPSIDQARAEWKFGDGGPVESVWWHSQDFNFSQAQTGYLMKPARFVEYCWDTPRTKKIFAGTPSEQWIYVDTNDRRSSSEFYVHRENPVQIGMNMDIPNESNQTYFGSCGMQHWISEYLIAKSLSVTSYFGNLIRGAQPRLAHKVGAFINSDSNSLRLMADSFGNIGYRSQMVPSENIKTYLYRSSSIGESFYGGVIVKQIRNGWQVYGFDGVDPFFSIIPSNQSGGKTTSVIGNQRMTHYSSGLTKNGNYVVERIPYGTVFGTRQDVYDFIISYGRWQENQGWVFEDYNDDNNTLFNWKQAATEYTYWSQANWANGNFIALSPLANNAKFKQQFGNIEFVNGIVRGTYPVLDRSGALIDGHNLEVLRYDDEIIVRPLNEQSIYGLRLFRTTIEHAIVLDNQTSFGDTIYDDLYNIAQPRLKMYAYRTNDWTGRLDAPGYFLYQNPGDNTWTMVPNLEKTTNDIRKYFNIEQPKNFDSVNSATGVVTLQSSQNSVIDRSDISDIAKHMFGYQKREYLQTLLLEDSVEFEFFQGFMRQKGTSSTIDKLLRNTSVVSAEETFEYYEEFALRSGRYGSVALNMSIAFKLPQDQFVNTPQQINVFGDLDSTRQANGIIVLIPNDPDFVTPPNDYVKDKFPLRNYYGINYRTDLPTAGYVKLGETEWYVVDNQALLSLYDNNVDTGKQLADRDTIWQFIDVANGWMVWQYTKTPASILNTTPSTNTGDPTTINCNGPHGLSNGDLVTLVGISNVDVLNGTYYVQNVNASGNTFQVPQNTFTVGFGGEIYAYQPIRFGNVSVRDSNPPVGGWKNGDMAYVDAGDIGINGWTVYKRKDDQWGAYRVENLKIDADLMLEANLFNTRKNQKLATLTYYDPAKGFIPGTADADIDIKSIIDPAIYTHGDSDLYNIDPKGAWESDKQGLTWWDLSAVRYLNYEMDDDSYRWKNWGRIAPGTSINIYEWVRSPVPPSNWSTYAAQGQTFSQYGINYAPSGTVKNASNPAWVQSIEYDSNGVSRTWYYFWVTGATTLPFPSERTKTTLEITNILSNPGAYGVSWYAAINPNSLIVSNVIRYLSSNDTMMQMIYTQKKNDANDHKQWELVREGDQYSNVSDYFWLKLHDSLIGFDGLGLPVPDINLNPSQRYGTLIRPRQSWFVNRFAAAKIYVNKTNELLSQVALRDDPDKVGWINYFFNEEPLPPAEGNYDYEVSTIAQRNRLGSSMTDGQRVLVLPTIENSYRWVIYQWVYATRSFKIVRIEEWKTQNYWSYVDYLNSSEGITSETKPNITVATLNELYDQTGPNGTVVKVMNNGNNLWELYKRIDLSWVRVGLEAGTIQLSSSLYDTTGYVSEFDGDGFDELGFDINPFTEFSNIFNGIRFAIFGTETNSNTIELNSIFFSMLNYVLSEQGFVDWIVKTSYLVLKGFNQPMYDGDLYQSDNIDSLLSYINEIRPYRSKIREFISGRTTNDNVVVTATDYDKPSYNGRILNPSVQTDANILATDSTFTSWWDNYQRNPQLIRTLKTTILFDRVASTSTGWSSYGWDVRSWSNEAGETATFGAFDRIQKFYKPTQGMIPLESDELISGTAFKGVILSGLGFRVGPGWNSAPWNNLAGWNANAMDFTDYLDIIVQGGAVPEYDSFYGDGRKKAFKLSRVPQDVSGTAVWSNGVLRRYGDEWIIPNWISTVTVVNRGTGYRVGDVLKLMIQPSFDDATVVVDSVTLAGEIIRLTVRSRGNYDLVPNAVISLEYPTYSPGPGTGATVQPVWGGDTLLFNEAPSAEPAQSVHVLYSGETFDPAPEGELDIVNDGYGFIQPDVSADHAEELYNARLKDSLRLDVYTIPSGGHPRVYIRSYATNGVVDQFDLVIKPQNESSVIASLNGTILKYGIAADYVINFYTNKLVFITPPAAGNLQLIIISTGGTGVGIHNPVVADPGTDYEINDSLFLTNGNRYVFGSGAGKPAKVAVVGLQCVGINIISGGTGYEVGDRLVLKDDSGTSSVSKLEVVVTAINTNVGSISSVVINAPGDYTYKPVLNEWITSSSTGTGAVITPVWGASRVQLLDQGLYVDDQVGPFTQIGSAVNGNIPSIGNGIVINATFTCTIGNDVFVADGATGTFNLSFLPEATNKMLVTIDGQIVDQNNVGINGQVLTLTVVPPQNSTVVVTGFNTDKFSVVREDGFTVTSGRYSYDLTNIPQSTMPQYSGLVILKNGLSLRPPPMDTYIGDGETTEFTLSWSPPFQVGLSVYVDSTFMYGLTDYVVIDDVVQFLVPPRAGAHIVLLVTNLNYGFDYVFNGPNVEFPSSVVTGWDQGMWDNFYGWVNADSTVRPDDEIRLITFTEDLSYGWITETFDSTGNGIFPLKNTPFDRNSIIVYVDGAVKTMLWDFTVDYASTTATIRFNPETAPALGSKVMVTYATGFDDRGPLAWRTLIEPNGSSISTAIDDQRKTFALSNVFVYSNEVEIADITKIGDASDANPGYIWIDSELISYSNVIPTGDSNYPLKGIITNLRRSQGGTSGMPEAVYNTIYYYGDGSNRYFPAESGTTPLAETVYVDGNIQVNNAIDQSKGTYGIVINPQGKPAGRYVVFNETSIPPVGWRNVRITALNTDAANTVPVHAAGATVIDASAGVRIPGGYNWQASPNGLQYSNSNMAIFLKEHQGTRS